MIHSSKLKLVGLILALLGNQNAFGSGKNDDSAVKEKSTQTEKPNLEPISTYDSWIGIMPGLSDGRIIILGIYPGGPADKAGLRNSDYILSINAQEIRSHEDLKFLVGKYKPGAEISLTYDRGKEINSVKLTIEKNPSIRDLIGRKAPKIKLERETDKKIFIVPQKDSKMKLVYFSADLYKPKFNEPFANLKKQIESRVPNIVTYGVGNQGCEEIKFVPSGLLNPKDEMVCQEQKIPELTKKMFEVYFDAQGKSEVLFFLKAWPALLIIDKENTIRYADIYTNQSDPEILKIIDKLK